MRNKMYWGFCALIILLLGVSAVLLLRDTDIDTEPEVVYTAPPEQPVKKLVLTPRPSVSRMLQVTGTLTADTLLSKVPFTVRDILDNAGENFVRIKYKEILKYLPDASHLNFHLANLTEKEIPKASNAYGKEAFKYVYFYPSDSWYSRWKFHTTQAIQSDSMRDSGCHINAFALQLSSSYRLRHIIVVTVEDPPPPQRVDRSDLCVLPPFVEFSLEEPPLGAVDKALNASK